MTAAVVDTQISKVPSQVPSSHMTFILIKTMCNRIVWQLTHH